MFFDRFDDVWYAVFCQFWNILFFLFSSKVWRLKKYLFWIPFWVNKKSIVLLVIRLRKIWQITVSKFAIFYSQSVTLTNLPSSTPATSQPPASRQPSTSQSVTSPTISQPAASHLPASRQPVPWRVCQTQISPSHTKNCRKTPNELARRVFITSRD